MRVGTIAAVMVSSLAAAWAAYAVGGADDEEFVELCIGKDRVLRFAESSQCTIGERRVRVSLWSPEKPEKADDEKETPKKAGGGPAEPGKGRTDPVSDNDAPGGVTPVVTQGIPPAGSSQRAPAPAVAPARNRIVAPFEVVDRSGRTILRVTEGGSDGQTRGAYIYTTVRQPVVSMTALNGGGLVRVNEGESLDSRVSMGAMPGTLGILVAREDQKQVLIGRNDYGGIVETFSSGEQARAALHTEANGSGSLVIYSQGGTAIASVAESDKVPGAGRLTANAPGGDGVFSAGYTPDSGGNACVNRKGNLWCLGTNLPLAIGK